LQKIFGAFERLRVEAHRPDEIHDTVADRLIIIDD